MTPAGSAARQSSTAPPAPVGPPAELDVSSTELTGATGATGVTGTTGTTVPAIKPGFVGIALELPAVPEFAGTDPAHPDPVLVQLIKNLAPGQAPLLRIGGDSTDYSWWPVAGMTAPPGITYALTPQWMAVAKGLAAALGGKLILGLEWAAHNTALTLAEANAYVTYIGRSTIADFELGNEPGYYAHFTWYTTPSGHDVRARKTTYGLVAYTKEFRSIVPQLPQVPMAGPGDGNLPGVINERRFLSGAPRLALVTFHRYPLIACTTDPANPTFPSTAHLLAPSSSKGLADGIAPYVNAATAARLPFRVDEMNSVSCRGAPVSTTFASALWALDQLFQFARVGVSGVNFNTFQDALYEPFAVTQANDGSWSADVRPMYYGMLMFSQAAPPGSHLLSLSLHHAGALRAWATRAPNGDTHVVLINDSLTKTRTVTVSVAGFSGSAELTRLSAPSVNATSGVTIGGQSFAAGTTTGQLSGTSTVTTVVPGADHGYVVTLPPASAAMLSL